MPIRICIVGGIFDKPEEYRLKHAISPETVLADGLRAAGFEVMERGHASFALDHKADIVHVHHFGRAALKMAAANRSAKFILTTHDGLILNGFSVNWKRRISDRFVARRADALVALSDAERTFLADRFAVETSKIEVIPNGVDGQVFGSGGRKSDRDPRSLVFVGQLQWFKGLDYLLCALPAIRNAVPGVRLTVVHQTDHLLGEHRTTAVRLGISKSVNFVGSKSPSELASLYSAASVVVVPSLAECLSTVITEAMCAGAAIVATDVGGVRTQLMGNGLIVPPADPDALAGAVIRFLTNQEERSRSGSAARERWRESFGVDQMIDSHIEIYTKLVRSKVFAADGGKQLVHRRDLAC